MLSIPLDSEALKIKFSDFPEFNPHYNPTECLELGIFGGSYFKSVSDRDWVVPIVFKDLDPLKYKNTETNPSINFFHELGNKPGSSKNIPLALRNLHRLGWFQWYTSFYWGQRSSADAIRIKQWQDELLTNSHYIRTGELPNDVLEENRWVDLDIFPTYRQSLLELAWDPTKDPKDYGIVEPY